MPSATRTTSAILFTALSIVAQRVPSFATDVQPILSEHCFACHGPDAASREAEMRLDRRADALAAGAFVPGAAAKSELVRRIRSADPDERMPPPDAGHALSAAQQRTLMAWIDAGALYETHWSFLPLPDRIAVPVLEDADRARGPIDRFVVARLEEAGLSPSPEAERWRWLRRVSFDLVGLPPDEDLVRAFEVDAQPDAYERIVDRLLASPRFGEHQAVHWLDVARYADSYGYQSDLLSPTWPWRDWVVRAFNRNEGFDRFVIDQVAGDLLENASREQVLATGFHRLHRMTNEGGSIREEFRVEYAADRVRTFGTAFLGLTLQCARCHDHKFDPISQRDYYSMMAFFNSIDEEGLYHDTSRVPTPSILLPTAAQEAALVPLEAELRDAREALARLDAGRRPGFETWLLASVHEAVPVEMPGMVAHYPLDSIDASGALENRVAGGASGKASGVHRVVDGRVGRALQLDGDEAAEFPDVLGKLDLDQPFTVALWIRLAEAQPTAIVLHRSGGTDVGYFGTELTLQRGRPRFAMVRHWPGNALAVQTERVIEPGRWTHVAISWDASYRAAGMRIDIDGAPASHVVRDELTKSPGHGGSGFAVGARFRDRGLRGAAIDEVRAFDRALAPVEVAHLVDGGSISRALRDADLSALLGLYCARFDAERESGRRRVTAAAKAVFAGRAPVQEAMVMRDTPTPMPTYLLERGAYDAECIPERRVERATPASLPPSDAGDRLGLVRWLVEPRHPLLARVTVNRIWQRFFGRGLVATADNFGLQGEQPSHPKLLDWLARDFVTSGWDMKRLCREIVLSATYRQRSALRSDLAERDPDNVLLARGPARRLAAEPLRDLALAASGLLDLTVGGPPVAPYQPPGLWRESNSMSPAYRQSVGTALYRRSLYSVWKRTAPLPNMTVFDVPARDVCAVARRDTNTPLQALVLLNDVQFVESARALAQVVLRREGLSRRERIDCAHLRLTGRSADARVMEVLDDLWSGQVELFSRDVASARALLGVGASTPDPLLDEVELAAATVVMQCIFNLDATVWKR